MIEQSGENADYQAIVKTTIDGIFVIDESGCVQSFNPAAERIFGYRSDEVIGCNVKMLTPQSNHGGQNAHYGNFHRTDITGTVRVEHEIDGLRKDGSLVPLTLEIAEWTSGGQHYFTEIVRDMTDRKLAEERGHAAEREMHKAQSDLEGLNRNLEERVLNEVAGREAAQWRALRAERIQALGQLAGGIAHDFNNVLQAVAGAADLLHSEGLQEAQIGRIADTIAKAAQRGTLVTERLLAFARRSPLKAELLDIAEVLNDIGRLLAQTLGSTITVRVDVEAALEPLMVDGGQLETVLINIATNARDAMPNGGVFTLSARRLLVANRESEVNGLTSGRYVRIAGSDTGIGMDEATVIKAGEPFFTTKPQGKGTGLGLSMAKGFAEQSGGGLTIESKLGGGTTVSISLPESNRSLKGLGDRSDDKTKLRILLVDDDEMVRDMMELQLSNAGYLVSLAGDGVEAVASFEAKGADLLLTDFSMPGMNGVKLITKLQERKPNLPAILLTGYTTEQVSWNLESPFHLIHKPVSQARLFQEVSSCLAASKLSEHRNGGVFS
jgi:PAS domain S-box-containing protein